MEFKKKVPVTVKMPKEMADFLDFVVGAGFVIGLDGRKIRVRNRSEAIRVAVALAMELMAEWMTKQAPIELRMAEK